MSVTLSINGIAAQADQGTLIFDLAQDAGIRVPTSCQKQGKCKECVVEIAEGTECLSAPTEFEHHLKGNFRLSCQCKIACDEGVVRCHTMRRRQMRIERGATTSIASRNGPTDPAVTRDGDRIFLDGQEIDRRNGPIHGIAVDLGTTTIVIRLHDLETGRLVADASFENPQRFGGSDVMSRIHYDCTNRGKLLMRTVAGYMSHTIEEFPVDPHSIYEAVIVGNSTMRDLYFRQNVHSIGQNPYQSITEIDLAGGKRSATSLTDTARRCLLPINPKARVYGGPIISGHVGADAAACMLAVGLARESRTVAIMDIGTNTELILGNKDRILAASCPAGPAFEGGAIHCGMPGLDGAIENVAIDEDGQFRIGVIGGGTPQGICGSGLVDLLGELLRTGRMNAMGRFEDDGPRIVVDGLHKIDFVESDVNELAQAKGANVAGLHVIFNSFGIDFDEIDVFYLAGGFGRHLRIDASRRIGLIPNIPDEKIVQIGNAAIEGASLALLSRSARAELESLVRRVQHCRLETHPQFFDFFVEGCQFKPVETLQVPRMIELADTSPDISVQPAEFTRLLGYPRGHDLEGRAAELTEDARAWFAQNGRPWIYAREASCLQLSSDSISIDGQLFTSKRLHATLANADAHSVILVAVSAGHEIEVQTQRLWQEEKPDEYFFLEVFGSAVVEHLITMTGARLCAWADGQTMAVLPHYSPGYPEWDISQQSRLLELIRRGTQSALPGPLEVLDSGMLRPKKSLLGVFGLTRHVNRVARLTNLNPCENCSYLGCQYRRAAYRRAPQPSNVEIPAARTEPEDEPPASLPPLNPAAKYTVNAKALARWAAERLTLTDTPDGGVEALFRYEGTTCSNMGRPLHFHYTLRLGSSQQGYPILSQRCAPAPGDDGYTYMCRYRTSAQPLMADIEQDQPLLGCPLNDVLTWSRNSATAGCYCEPASRIHKWALVLETVHYALARRQSLE